MSYDGYKANWGRSTNIDRGTSKNHLQAADLNSVYTTVSGNSASWSGDTAISTDTQAIKTFHSTDDEYHNVQLLLHCEGTNNDTDMDDDSRVGHHFEFKGNSKLSSTQKKFGSTSLFTGTSDNDHILVDSDDTNFLELGTGDFTLEFWLYWDGLTGYQSLFDNGYGSGSTAGGWLIQSDNNNGRLRWYHNGGLLIAEGSDATTTTWTHYAIVRSSGTMKIYRNGIQTATASNTNPYFTPDKLSIGARKDGTYPFDGYYDEIRLTKGVARYSGSDTSSANFTVPSAAFSGEALESTTVVTGISGSVADGTKIDSTYTTTNSNSASWDQAAKAWVNFNGTGTPAIRTSYNVSSISDIGTGSYIIVFTESMTDANYVVAGYTSGENTNGNRGPNYFVSVNPQTSGVHIQGYYGSTSTSNGAANDTSITAAAIFGN